jgi:hypothetical protein
VQKLADAIDNLAQDKALAVEFGKQGLLDYQDKFMPDFHIDKLYKTFDELTGRR